MLISKRYNFIFVHIYKCGGTSVASALVPYANLRFRFTYEWFLSRKAIGLFERTLCLQDKGQSFFTGYHKHSSALEIRDKLGDSVFNRYYTFTFVRNPFTFVYSLFRYIGGTRSHKDHAIVRQMSFDQFIEYHIDSNPSTQKSLISDTNGVVLVNFVGRFESITEDFNRLCRDANIPACTLPHLNSSTNFTNSIPGRFSSFAQDQICKYYYDDFETFSYPKSI